MTFLADDFSPSSTCNLHPRLTVLFDASRTAHCFVLCALLPLHASERNARALADLSIEELMNESVTSVAKKEQKLGDVASAITVLTNDDLRRSGATMLADALRGVPGLAVGALNASQRAVSARGFNSTFANKQLVLVDGRAVYDPIFSGVYWDMQQPMLDDLERVEIIRGPGATVWGANAVNGVISVISRSARDTQGGLLYGAAGTSDAVSGGARHGGKIGSDTYYRVYAAHQTLPEGELANGAAANDAASSTRAGFRLDRYVDAGVHATWQTEAQQGKFDGNSDAYNFHTLGRATFGNTADAGIEAQIYFDRTHRNNLVHAEYTSDTLDLSLQQTLRLGRRNQVVWGAGYRYIHSELEKVAPTIQLRMRHFTQEVFSAFVQDEITLIDDRLAVTFGAKVEHNEITGFEYQPSLRAMFKPTRHQTLWAAVSRALRTPNALEAIDAVAAGYGEPIPAPGGLYRLYVESDPRIRSETLAAYELGYRVQPSRNLSVDLATFFNDYKDLIGVDGTPRFVPGTPIGAAYAPWANVYRAHAYGAELSLTAALSPAWRVTSAYSALRTTFHAIRGIPSSVGREAPRQQLSLRSSYDFGARASLDAHVRAVSHFSSVSGYTTADVRFAWRFNDDVELSLTARNLLDARHPEQPLDPSGVMSSEVPRTFQAKVTWRFR